MPAHTEKKQKARASRSSSRVAYEALRKLIIEGRLSPGSRIIEAELVERLHLSRTPIRAALDGLHRDGYVHSIGSHRRSRLIVAPLTREDARELYTIVGRLEGLCARQAAELPRQQRERLAADLTQLNLRLKEQASAEPPKAHQVYKLDIDFHAAVVEAGAGPRLMVIHRAVKPQIERYWRLYASSMLVHPEDSVMEHERIIHAIRNGNADAAERSIQFNWENGATRLSRMISVYGERGIW